MTYSDFSHLVNPYNNNNPVFNGVDGQVIKQNIAEELCRIFEAKVISSHLENQPSTSRDDDNGFSDSDSFASTSKGGRPLFKRGSNSYYNPTGV